MFAALGQRKSFRKAGDDLGVSQSAVSQMLAGWETKLGYKLVERGRHVFKLTPEGKVYWEYGQEINQLIEQLAQQMKVARETAATTFSLMAPPSLVLYLMPVWLKSFQSQFPAACIQLRYGRTESVYAALKQFKLDLGLVLYPDTHAGIKVEVVQTSRLVLVCSPRHPLAARSNVNPIKLKGQRFVGWSAIPPRRSLLPLPVAFRQEFAPHWMFDEVDMVKAVVLVEQACAFLPEPLVRSELAEKKLVEVTLTERGLIVPWAIVYAQHQRLTPTMTAFIQFLKRPLAS